MDRLLVRDEREVSLDRAADRLAYVVLSFGLLAVVAYRSFVEGVASWELLGLVLLGGIVSTGYRLWHGVLTRQAVLVLALTALIARRGRRPRPSPMSWMTIGSSKHR